MQGKELAAPAARIQRSTAQHSVAHTAQHSAVSEKRALNGVGGGRGRCVSRGNGRAAHTYTRAALSVRRLMGAQALCAPWRAAPRGALSGEWSQMRLEEMRGDVRRCEEV